MRTPPLGPVVRGDLNDSPPLSLNYHIHLLFLHSFIYGKKSSLHTSQVAHQAGAYPGFCSNEATRSISALSWMGCYSIAGLPPGIKFGGTH